MNRRRFLTVTVGVLVLSAGLVLANYGGGVTPAGAKDLNGVTPNWDQNLPSASRFTTVFTGAVRDNNTGLVWEKAPDATTPGPAWGVAARYCANKNVGGTRGWRLPSLPELASLIDPSLAAPYVPASAFTIGGNPGVQSAGYWSATTRLGVPTDAWFVNFNDGNVSNDNKADSTSPYHVWCVRGGMNADAF